MEQTTQTYQLPLGIVSKVDVGRLLRELETLDTFLKGAQVRQPGTSVQLPKTSKLLDEFLEVNKKSALKDEDRKEITDFLTKLRKDAPTIHMSFSADPSPLFTQRMISWLRQNIHPSLLLQIGLQPTIGAGAIVRTTNKYFDFSLREFFNNKKAVLLAKMRSTETQSEETNANETAQVANSKSQEDNGAAQPPATMPTSSTQDHQTVQAGDDSTPETTLRQEVVE